MLYNEAYLDIETTGLSPLYSEITVIGVYLVNGSSDTTVQLVGNQVTINNLLECLSGVDKIYTYNGSRFDLPFINRSLGIDLETVAAHRDLMYDCWRCNLYGGLKSVEQQLSISRQLQGITGYDAVILWRKYQKQGDQKALELLLHYNKEDVINLKVLRERLGV